MNKLDLIIAALENSKPINKESSIPFDKHLKALTAARELRALEPVAWTHPDFDIAVLRKPQPFQIEGWTPLFSLGESNE